MTDKELMYQEMIQENMENSRRDYELSQDYDRFCNYYEDEFKQARESLQRLKDLHKQYGYDLDTGDML